VRTVKDGRRGSAVPVTVIELSPSLLTSRMALRRPFVLVVAFLAGCALCGLAAWRLSLDGLSARPKGSSALSKPSTPRTLVDPLVVASSEAGLDHRNTESSDSGSPFDPPAKVVVRGRVSAPVQDLEQVDVELQPGRSRRPAPSGDKLRNFHEAFRSRRCVAPVDAPGQFEVDATTLLRDEYVGDLDLTRPIHVVASHPLCSGEYVTVRVPDLTASMSSNGSSSSREVVIDVVLELRAGTLLTGTVRSGVLELGSDFVVAAAVLESFDVGSDSPGGAETLERFLGRVLDQAERERLAVD
jgi:hypothetical protein